eukprot:3928085-Pyramimonas_sp.AAC.1
MPTLQKAGRLSTTTCSQYPCSLLATQRKSRARPQAYRLSAGRTRAADAGVDRGIFPLGSRIHSPRLRSFDLGHSMFDNYCWDSECRRVALPASVNECLPLCFSVAPWLLRCPGHCASCAGRKGAGHRAN